MSTELNKDMGDAFVETVVPLMKEYSTILNDTSASLFATAEQLSALLDAGEENQQRVTVLRSKFRGLQSRINRLRSAVHELDLRVSQMIQSGKLNSKIDRVELQLRLAELEASLDEAENAAAIQWK